MIRVTVKRPYLDFHDLWAGIYWRPEFGGVRVYWCPLPALVVRVDLTARRAAR